jgi:cytidine deaminase
MKLTNEDKKLIETAHELIKKRGSNTAGCACALITEKGNIYTGVNLGVENPSAVCAEPVAVGSMLTNGEDKAKTIVTVNKKGGISSPCGVCRELIHELNVGNPFMIINKEEKVKLNELLPHAWVDDDKK